MTKIVTHPGARTDRNPTPEAIGAIKLHSILQGVGGWGISEDFIVGQSAGVAFPGWDLTDVDSGDLTSEAFTLVAGKGGLGRIDSGSSTAEHESVQAQLKGGAFTPTVGAKIYFGALLKVSTINGVNFVGLSTPNEEVFNGSDSGMHADAASHIGFQVTGGDVKFFGSGDAAIDTNINAVADEFIKLEFVVSDANSVIPYVNGIQYPAAKLSSPPVLVMTPSIAHSIGSDGTENVYVTMDWIKCYQSEDIVRVGSA